jgi:DNA transformation protein
MANEDQLAELFAPLRGVTIRRMFGGMGIFKDGMMFSLVARDVLYMRADDDFAKRFREQGSRQWSPVMRGREMVRPYWQVPERLFDEPEEFAEWARQAFAVTKRLRAEKDKQAAKRKRAARAKKPKTKTAPRSR